MPKVEDIIIQKSFHVKMHKSEKRYISLLKVNMPACDDFYFDLIQRNYLHTDDVLYQEASCII